MKSTIADFSKTAEACHEMFSTAEELSLAAATQAGEVALHCGRNCAVEPDASSECSSLSVCVCPYLFVMSAPFSGSVQPYVPTQRLIV